MFCLDCYFAVWWHIAGVSTRENRHRSFTFSLIKCSGFSNLFSRKSCHLAALAGLLNVMNGNSHSITPALKFLGVLTILCYRACRVRCNRSTQCCRVTICTTNLFLWEQKGFEQPNAMVVLSCKCGRMMAVPALAALQHHMAFSTTVFAKPFTSCFLHIYINTSKLWNRPHCLIFVHMFLLYLDVILLSLFLPSELSIFMSKFIKITENHSKAVLHQLLF